MKEEVWPRGAYDLQVHVEPDVVPRKQDAIELIADARQAGMAGILIKDHMTLTSDRARLLSKIYDDIEVYGSLALNYPVGGLNPEGVKAASRCGVAKVYITTFSAAWDIEKNGGIPSHFQDFFPEGESRGLRIVDDRERLLPSVEKILDIMASSEAILGTGHLSPRESLILIEQAALRGVKKILVTHAMLELVDMSVEEQKEAVQMGAMIEQSYLACTPLVCDDPEKQLQRMATQIREVGASNVILSTDLGQTGNIKPVAGIKEFAQKLFQCGIEADQVELMLKHNPRRLLESLHPGSAGWDQAGNRKGRRSGDYRQA